MKRSRIILPLSTVLGLLLFTGCQKQPSMQSYKTFPKNPNYTIIKPQKTHQFTEENLASMIKKLEGRPYVWAEEGPYCFDCSGYLYYMFGSMGVDIPRVAREQIKSGQPIALEELKFGDFVFFDTTRAKLGKITHVGIYLKDGWFSHASSADKKITYGNLFTSKYYKERYKGARRYYEQKDGTYIAFQPKMQNYIAQAAPVNNVTKPVMVASKKETEPAVLALAENKQVNSAVNDIKIDMSITENTSADTPRASDEELQKESLSTQQTIATQTTSTAVSETDTQTSTHDEAKIEKKADKGYYVQVGKFQHKPDRVFLKKITSKGYAYTIVPISENGKKTSKLLIGPFNNKNDANNTLISVKENIVKEAFVTKVSS
ncbi:MAG: NlpC/P60 family protein [Sulfurovaceae bacterium]